MFYCVKVYIIILNENGKDFSFIQFTFKYIFLDFSFKHWNLKVLKITTGNSIYRT